MAKQDGGYLGNFRGRLGPAVGYEWNGRWCLRSLPGQVRNPRTEAQQAHRRMFKQQVQLASAMLSAVSLGLGVAARGMQMTTSNLFVKANQHAFSDVDGVLQVDWAALTLSVGPVAPVAFGEAVVETGNVLRVSYEKNPLHLRANESDNVYLYLYCPELGEGFLTQPEYRRRREISVVVPDTFAGREVQLWGFVQDREGRCSETLYIGNGPVVEGAVIGSQVVDGEESSALEVLLAEQVVDGLHGVEGGHRHLDKEGDPVGHGAVP